MKRGIALFSFVIMLCMLTACGPKKDESPTKTTPSKTTTQTSTAAPSKKVVVKISYASDEFMTNEDGYDSYLDTDSEYAANALFTSDTEIDDFMFASLDFVENEDDSIGFCVDKILYGPAMLTPDRPIAVKMLVDGALPNRGIIYTDENGITRYFTVSMSGKDDSLLLTEFVPAK